MAFFKCSGNIDPILLRLFSLCLSVCLTHTNTESLTITYHIMLSSSSTSLDFVSSNSLSLSLSLSLCIYSQYWDFVYISLCFWSLVQTFHLGFFRRPRLRHPQVGSLLFLSTFTVMTYLFVSWENGGKEDY